MRTEPAVLEMAAPTTPIRRSAGLWPTASRHSRRGWRGCGTWRRAGIPAPTSAASSLEAQISSLCVADGEAPPVLVPVDPDMPVDPDAPAGPAAKQRSARVFCVRRCDGAFYPLAVDVLSDWMGDMDRICQAQCPASASAAYAGEGADDVADAVASDGSPYSALPGAFKFRHGSTPACACRAPHQSWADALAGADALLEPHEGDVTVTAALSAAMARPARSPGKATSAAPVSPGKVPRRTKAPVVVPPATPSPVLDRDLTREFRRSGSQP